MNSGLTGLCVKCARSDPDYSQNLHLGGINADFVTNSVLNLHFLVTRYSAALFANRTDDQINADDQNDEGNIYCATA